MTTWHVHIIILYCTWEYGPAVRVIMLMLFGLNFFSMGDYKSRVFAGVGVTPTPTPNRLGVNSLGMC